MDASERIRQELLEEFRETARERIERIVSCWLSLEQNRADAASAQEAMRQLHSLKGEAKMMSFADVSLVAHRCEDLFAAAQREEFVVPPEFGDVLLAAADAIGSLIQKKAGTGEHNVDLSQLIGRMDAVLAEMKAKGGASDAREPAEIVVPDRGEQSPVKQADERLRVSMEIVTQFSETASELVITERQLEHSLERVQRAVRSIGGADRRAIERVEVELKALAEQIHQGVLQAENIEHLARQMRLVPIGTVLKRYARAIRDLAKEQAKRIEVEIQDGGVSLDKIVIDRISEPLLHLVRNAVDHGIESPMDREKRGKPPSARIALEAVRKGAIITISVTDDGRGIDLSEVKKRAIERRLIAEGEASVASDAQLIDLLFLPGFSTRKTTTETSGRGVGLDVVKREVESIGGHVRLETTPNLGTRFELCVPVNLSLTRVLVIEAAGALHALPLTSVERVLTVFEQDIVVLREQAHLRSGDDLIPLMHFASAIGVADAGGTLCGKAVIVRHGAHAIAMKVDRWRDVADVIVKSLGPVLEGCVLFNGACVLRDAQLALVLNPAELASRAIAVRSIGAR